MTRQVLLRSEMTESGSDLIKVWCVVSNHMFDFFQIFIDSPLFTIPPIIGLGLGLFFARRSSGGWKAKLFVVIFMILLVHGLAWLTAVFYVMNAIIENGGT